MLLYKHRLLLSFLYLPNHPKNWGAIFVLDRGNEILPVGWHFAQGIKKFAQSCPTQNYGMLGSQTQRTKLTSPGHSLVHPPPLFTSTPTGLKFGHAHFAEALSCPRIRGARPQSLIWPFRLTSIRPLLMLKTSLGKFLALLIIFKR